MSSPQWLRPLPGSNGFVVPRTGGVVAALLNPRLMAATPPELKRIEAEASERIEAGGFALIEAGGFAAISRWLSAATPPVRHHDPMCCIPAGMPARAVDRLRPLPGSNVLAGREPGVSSLRSSTPG